MIQICQNEEGFYTRSNKHAMETWNLTVLCF